MTPEQFSNEMESMDLIRKGNGPKIAKRAKIRYPTYMNAMRGYVSNPEILESIVQATKELFEEAKQIKQADVA